MPPLDATPIYTASHLVLRTNNYSTPKLKDGFVFDVLLVYFQDEMMSEDYMGELLYNHKILPLSALMDICALYSHKYPEYIASMLDTLFRIEPRYALNLETFIDEVFEVSTPLLCAG